jgi:hypothetical protein
VENTRRYSSRGQSQIYEFVQIPSQSEGQAAIANIAGKKPKNHVANAAAALALSNKDGAAISRTGNNNRSNNRRGE